LQIVLALGPFRLGLLGVSAVLSVVSFALYGGDKAAARRGARRTPELVLHLASVAGGWPGALLGQRVFRHKTRKQPFRTIFWCTVVINGLAVVWALTALPAA
jgi:uncharacterized membrane protein YsdA (DUF1294 family)